MEAVKRRWGLVAAVTAGTLLTAVLVNQLRQDEPDLPVERHQAEELLHEAARLAQAGDFDGLCQSVATTTGMCEFLLQTARDGGWKPGPDLPRVVGATRRDESLTLHLTGTRADGSSYTADFHVVRERGELRSATPVYWSGVRFEDSECTTSATSVECSNVVLPSTAGT
jgi:hypothetical protein